MKHSAAALACCLLLGSCSTLPRAVTKSSHPHRRAEPERTFHVVSHGWHTGVIVRAKDLDALVPELPRRFHGRTYYELGWGDAGFYQARHVTPGLAMQAMFASPGTVVHVVAFDRDPQAFFPYSRTAAVRVGAEGYDRMLEYLRSSFAADARGRVIPLGPGLYGDSSFYPGVGRYHLFNTCNKWTAKALYSAGCGIDPSVTLRSAGVMKSLERPEHRPPATHKTPG